MNRENLEGWSSRRLVLQYLSQSYFRYFINLHYCLTVIKYNKTSGFSEKKFSWFSNCRTITWQVWKNSLFRKKYQQLKFNLTVVAILKLHFSLYLKFIYNLCNKNKFIIIVYNSLFRFASTSTLDDWRWTNPGNIFWHLEKKSQKKNPKKYQTSFFTGRACSWHRFIL